MNSIGIIVRPPGNITICDGDTITVNCGYESDTPLPVTWIINGRSFTQEELNNSLYNYKYHLNNPTTPPNASLTIKNIYGNTTTQCVVHSTSNITSGIGRVTTIGMVILIFNYVHTVPTYVCGNVHGLFTCILNRNSLFSGQLKHCSHPQARTQCYCS